MVMKIALPVNRRPTAGEILDKTAAICRESGWSGLAARVCHRLAAPIVKWGGITFFERRLDTHPQEGETLPGLVIRQLGPWEVDALLRGGDPTQSISDLAERFTRGDRAFGAIDATGRICHVRWVSTTRVRIPEIDRDICLRPGDAYCYNAYTRADARRRGIDGLVRHFVFKTLQEEGFRTVYSYVRLDNPDGLRAASRWQRPIGTIRYITPRYFTPLIKGTSTSGLPRLVLSMQGI
jgi:hypothetical protein